PPRPAPAPERRDERGAVRGGVAAGGRAVVVRERVAEPAVDVAAVRERAALDDAPIVDAVEEQARARERRLRVVHGAKSSRSPDRERSALARDAAGADV